MKTQLIKLLLSSFFIAILVSSYAQTNEEQERNHERERQRGEQQEGLDFRVISPLLEALVNQPRIEPKTIYDLKPRWFCPFLYTSRMDGTYSFTELVVTNFSNKSVNYRLVFYDQNGKVVKTYPEQLKGKALRYLRLNSIFFEGDDFTGSVELQANSPALFPTAHFQEDGEAYLFGQHQFFQYNYDWVWYRLDE